MRMDNFTNVCEATSQSHELDNYRPTHRKGKKLLAEKKRRARINNCLMQIRDIVCEGEEEKDTDLEKMEKAEILEKTLEVLTRLRHDYTSQSSSSFSTRKAMAVRYASGFSSCAEESIRYIQNSRLVPAEVKVQLQNHLRAIAHRMESSLQGEGQSLNSPSSYQASTSLLSSPTSFSSDRLAEVGDLREDISMSSIDRVPGQMSDSSTYYISSPIHFSTPGVQTHMPCNTSVSQSAQQEHECVTHAPETFMKHDFAHQQMKQSDRLTSETSNSHQHLMKPTDKEVYASSLLHHSQSLTQGSTKDKQFITFMSPNAVYPPSAISLTEATPSTNSPVIFYSSPILSDQPVFSYQVYEPYPTVPSILVQPVTYLSTPVRQIQTSISATQKQPSTLSSALDLCVKRSEDHQISPETMWRPW